jgi:hypothetical protein
MSSCSWDFACRINQEKPMNECNELGRDPTSDRPMHQILEHCSTGPWHHGLRVPPFSADSQPCVYGNVHDLPLAMLDDTDPDAFANVILMAAAWELCEQLGTLVDAAAENTRLRGAESTRLRNECHSTLVLLSRIRSDMRKSNVERYGQEADE